MSRGRCIYCGAECYGRACRAHSDLRRVDIWEGSGLSSSAMWRPNPSGEHGAQGDPATEADSPHETLASSTVGRAPHLHSSGVPSSRGRVS